MYIYKYIVEEQKEKIKLFGLTIYRCMPIQIKSRTFKESQYLKGIFKIIKNNCEKRFYICGIRIAKIKRQVDYNMIEEIVKSKTSKTEHQISKLESKMDKLERQISEFHWDSYILTQAPIVHKCLEQYKRCYEGKDIVIVATGPSAQYYKDLIPDAIHIGINAAIRYDWINLDYVFSNDAFLSNPDLNIAINNYKKETCKKFYGMHSPRNLDLIQKRGLKVERIPQSYLYDANAHRYLLQEARIKKWAINIECEPFGDIGSTTFSALQFACYTHPRKIYLVGCDASSSYSETGGRGVQDYTFSIKLWQSFADFVKAIYPDTQVISINPVNLKGMFEDIYTDNFNNAQM